MKSPNQPSVKEELEKENELYIILADYSNDLNQLKKRDGKLPAQAAVNRLQAIITQRCIEELESFTYCGAEKWEIDERIKQLKEKDTTVT